MGRISAENPFYALHPVSPGRLALYFDQFSQMLHAGVTMHEALSHLGSRGIDGRLRRATEQMVEPIAQGAPLSEQMARFPELFPPHVRGLMRAGEASGRLDTITAEIAEEYRGQQRRAWVIILTKLWFALPLLLIPFIIPLPKILEFNPDLQAGLDWYFGFLLRVSLPLVAGVIMLYLLLKVVINLRAVRGVRDRLAYATPVAGMLVRQAAMERYLIALEALIGAGVQIQEAMSIAAEAGGNTEVERQMAEIARKVRNGMPVGAALAKARVIPTDVKQSHRRLHAASADQQRHRRHRRRLRLQALHRVDDQGDGEVA
jgi:type II secretory pathway component PulF